MKLKTLFSCLFLCGVMLSCSTKRKKDTSALTQKNQNVFNFKPLFPLIAGCEGAQSSSCLENAISYIIIDESIKRKMVFVNDTVNVGISFKANGKLDLITNTTNNSLLKKLIVDILPSIDLLAPAYSEREKRYVSHTNLWFIIIKNNEHVNPSNY
ncbi:hypothetical protein F0365_12960 [Nonlabens sp. Ci31]|uniref:hypothetical protein n=1 Tax=Nonlabens sp. Ci31 TaxID=2608253 RepID=UPI001463630F|nr:hypothetical protein [Nonlabens sp. Ci31]QJP35234.1 hypothetical protein F0365_12960 [Nonlabens sp. Ci31]